MTASAEEEAMEDTLRIDVTEGLPSEYGRVEEIVFAVRQPGKDGHWYANFGYYAENTERLTYGDGGRLCKLNLKTGQVTHLIDDPTGGVRDPQVDYDARKILFSYRKGGSPHYHLYEVDLDGGHLRQLTDGDCDDIEPSYLPDGGIVFCSSRCNRWVNCWLTQVAILYRCEADGGNVRQISSSGEHDNTPWPLPDGRILYQRWEYVDRSQVHYHHLWTMNPDGTNQMVFFGNLNPGIVMIDAKPIPGTNRILASFSPGHGTKEHDGVVTIVDPSAGPDDPTRARPVHPSRRFRDPYPIASKLFIAAHRGKLVLLNEDGLTRKLFELSEFDSLAGLECHEPRPVAPRPRDLVIPPKSDPEKETGRLVLSNIYEGRNMEGVSKGEIKKLLVLESLPKPINFTGGMEPLSYGGTFTLERVLGTVPVEPDGSAYFEIPALRSVFLVALDDRDLSVKRMQSFLTVQPGEVVGCVGCHEQRTRTLMPPRGDLMALDHPPSKIEPIPGVPDVFDFPRDIQPILDRHCVGCHGYEGTEKGGPRAGGVILSGDRGPMFSHSYFTLSARLQLADGRNRPVSNYPPRGIGSSASSLMKKIDEGHQGVRLAPLDRDMVRLWIDTGGPYPGTYAGLGCGMIGGYAENVLDRSDLEWPSMRAALDAMESRCGNCHRGTLALPSSPSDDMDMPPWAIKYDDPRLRFSRHILYNLTHPELSLLLLAPLAKEAGGHGICHALSEGSETTAQSPPVFNDPNDADYRTILAAIRDAKDRLEQIKRFDMPGFSPRQEYVREMRRYGILPGEGDLDQALDPYVLDRAYWQSLWHQPSRGTR
ncbi:MAG: hypothetical protein HUU16_00485 [Candidatus Omnitrophica bacterium]|nr:hypothetical protein [Candidatus Omnitrophota bacterium]